jgi:hypothetical protein
MIDPQPAASEPHSDAKRLLVSLGQTPAQPATDETTRAAVDAAIRAHVADKLDDSELIVNWIVVAGTRDLASGGGSTIVIAHAAMPQWETEGILSRALKIIDRAEDDE